MSCGGCAGKKPAAPAGQTAITARVAVCGECDEAVEQEYGRLACPHAPNAFGRPCHVAWFTLVQDGAKRCPKGKW